MHITFHIVALVVYALVFCLDACLLISVILSGLKVKWVSISAHRLFQIWIATGIGAMLGSLVGVLMQFIS